MILKYLINDRVDKDFINASFEYTDTRYRFFQEEYYHAYNIDPEYPIILVREGVFRTIINRRFIYNWQKCE